MNWLIDPTRGIVTMQRWRVGRSALIVPGSGEVHGSIQVTKPMFGLIGMIDQSLAGVHVYDVQSGLHVDTLMTPGDANHEMLSVYTSPGEFFVGAAAARARADVHP